MVHFLSITKKTIIEKDYEKNNLRFTYWHTIPWWM